jgi:hypothetical protein
MRRCRYPTHVRLESRSQSPRASHCEVRSQSRERPGRRITPRRSRVDVDPCDFFAFAIQEPHATCVVRDLVGGDHDVVLARASSDRRLRRRRLEDERFRLSSAEERGCRRAVPVESADVDAEILARTASANGGLSRGGSRRLRAASRRRLDTCLGATRWGGLFVVGARRGLGFRRGWVGVGYGGRRGSRGREWLRAVRLRARASDT